MEITFNKRNKNNVNAALQGNKSIKKLTKEELHQFVLNYNFDDSYEPLIWLVNQKICDKGTALSLYWMLEPDFHYNKGNTKIFEESYKLIKLIEEKYLTEFYETEWFSFNPKIKYVNDSSNFPSIPKIMLEPTIGVNFDRIDVEPAFLRSPTEIEINSINKNIAKAVSIIQNLYPEFELNNIPENYISHIANCVDYMKGKDLIKTKIECLSYLWLLCLIVKYDWTWVVWDWETGKNFGVTNKDKSLTCLSDTIIKHTMDGFQPTSIFHNLFNDLKGVTSLAELNNYSYTGIGLLFSTEHLKFIINKKSNCV